MENKKNNPTKNSALAGRKRTLSRVMAIQIFYQFEFHKKAIPLEDLKSDLIDHYAISAEDEVRSYRSQIDETLIQNLIGGMNLAFEEIDTEIKPLLKNAAELSDMLLQIIRFGAFELKFSKNIALKIIINEYLDIASFFFADKQVKFVNSILEKLAQKYREEELTKTKKND